MSASVVLSFAGFSAYDLPRERWLKLVNPKMRLRVRGKKRNFVSSVVKVDNNRRPDAEADMESCIHWPWNDDGQFTRPSFADDEVFEIAIERRFLLGYKCIRRTKSVTIDQVCPRDRDSSSPECTLALYDGQYSAWELEDENRVRIGKITFTLS